MLIERMVFGCGRLTGGASEREALALVGACLDAGVRGFDVAPSYGIGTAEAVIGKALKHRRDCVIVTKLGSTPDPRGRAKTWARAIKRLVRPAPPRRGAAFTPVRQVSENSGCHWDEAHLREKLDRSLGLLGRIDRLYLHDPIPAQVDAALIALVDELAANVGAAPGYATAAVWSAAEDAIYPAGWLAQAAVEPDWLTGAVVAPASGTLTVHSMVMTADWLAVHDAGFAAGLDRASAVAGNRVAALLAVAAARVPAAGLVFASADRARLGALLSACRQIDAGKQAEIVACF